MTSVPQQIAGAEVSKAPETEPVAAPADSAGAPAQPAAEQPATTAEVPAQPAAEQPAATAEAPAAAKQQEAAVQPEQPAPAVEATAPAPAEQQAATVQPEQPAPAAEAAAPALANQQTATVQPEQPAPAAEAAAPASDTPATSAPPPAAGTAKEDLPTFDTVRIEKSGEAVIAGTAEAGAEVVVKLDGETIGKTVANSDGAFVVVPDAPIPSGSGALTIEATGKGDATPMQSEESVAVIVPASEEKNDALVALVSPDAPTKVLQKAEPEPAPATEVAAADPAAVAPAEPAAASQPTAEQPAAEQPAATVPAAKPAQLVSIDAVDYDGSGNIVFSGRGEPGNGARIYVDNKFVGDAAVGEDGRWSFAGTADIAQGVHALRVDGIDAKGTVINRVEVPFFREDTKKAVAAATPAEQPAPAETNQTVAKTTPEPAPATETPLAPEQQTVAKTTPEAAPATETPLSPEQQTMAKTTPEAAPATETPLSPEQQTAAVAANAQPEAAAPEAPKNGRVVIQPGNNLWRISRVLYGSGTKYTLLYQANKDQIRDPDMIYPGQIFTTPDVASKTETIDPDRRDPLTPEENAASAQQN